MAYLEVEGMKRRRKKIMLIIPAAVICVAGAGTVGYFKVAHTKPVQNVTAQAQSAEAKKGIFPRQLWVPVIWSLLRPKIRMRLPVLRSVK